MLINKAYRFRIYPNKKQRVLIAKTIGCSRFVFNHFLAKWDSAYKDTGKGLSYHTCSAKLTQLKKQEDTIWLKEADSISLQSSLKNLADGTVHHNPKYFRSVEKKLAKARQVLSRRKELAINRNCRLSEAKNYQKQRVKVARIHESIANKRKDYLHKISTEIIKNHDVIGIEDLQVANLLKNKKLAKSISEVSWSQFRTLLEYKAEWYGKKLLLSERHSLQVNFVRDAALKTKTLRILLCVNGTVQNANVITTEILTQV